MPAIRTILIALTALLTTTASGRAQSIVERIEPPVAQRGKTTRVTFIGSQLAQTVDVWASLPAGALKATPVGASEAGRAVVDLQIAADAPIGLCGLRLATRDGLSNVHLFLIDDLPPLAAKNGEPQPVNLPAAAWGSLRGESVDRFAITVSAGQRVSFEAVGNRFGKDIDPLITIRDAAGKKLAERDNDVGLCFDCRFEHVFAAAGTYHVEIRDSRYQAPDHATYVLRMGRFPAARVAVPAAVKPGQRTELRLPEAGGAPVAVELPAAQGAGPLVAALRRPDDEAATWLPLLATPSAVTVATAPCASAEQATPAVVPGVLCGVLEKPGARDWFRLDLEKGQKLRIKGEARSLQSPADLELAIVDAKGAEVRRANDPGKDDVTFDWAAPAAGAFYLTVRDLARDGGPAFAYRITVGAPQPTVTITADVEGLTIPRGNYQSLPLVITRSERAGVLKLRLVDAPVGLALTPAEIAEGETTVLARLTASADAPLGLRSVQIIAEAAQADGPSPTLVRTTPLVDHRRVNVDLIPYALREDQTRLPAALHDRLAVQITEAAPFTLELPEALVTLARYQHADFPLQTTRTPGFATPITFAARGGQLGPKDDIRSRVFAEFPSATPDTRDVKGSIHARILSNTARTRIEVEGTALHEGRKITLTRSFDLDLRPAFRVAGPMEKLTLLPDTTTRVRLLANRVPPFAGAVTLHLQPPVGYELPAQVDIPAGQDGIDVEIKVPASAQPGRVQFRARCVALVGAFEEEQPAQLLEIEIPKPAPAKK